MNRTTYAFLAIFVCAACTFLLRWIPFALFGGKRGMPESVRKLANRMPAAIIAVLVVFCLKGVPTANGTEVASTLLSVAAVVLLHVWKRSTLLSIAGGTALYMLLIRVL